MTSLNDTVSKFIVFSQQHVNKSYIDDRTRQLLRTHQKKTKPALAFNFIFVSDIQDLLSCSQLVSRINIPIIDYCLQHQILVIVANLGHRVSISSTLDIVKKFGRVSSCVEYLKTLLVPTEYPCNVLNLVNGVDGTLQNRVDDFLKCVDQVQVCIN